MSKERIMALLRVKEKGTTVGYTVLVGGDSSPIYLKPDVLLKYCSDGLVVNCKVSGSGVAGKCGFNFDGYRTVHVNREVSPNIAENNRMLVKAMTEEALKEINNNQRMRVFYNIINGIAETPKLENKKQESFVVENHLIFGSDRQYLVVGFTVRNISNETREYLGVQLEPNHAICVSFAKLRKYTDKDTKLLNGKYGLQNAVYGFKNRNGECIPLLIQKPRKGGITPEYIARLERVAEYDTAQVWRVIQPYCAIEEFKLYDGIKATNLPKAVAGGSTECGIDMKELRRRLKEV